jgi:hypothetical protein
MTDKTPEGDLLNYNTRVTRERLALFYMRWLRRYQYQYMRKPVDSPQPL